MKKLLSLTLCVCMVITCFATMLTTVSAQNTVTSIPNANAIPTLTKSEQIYYEDFESTALETLTNENLMSTLGWSGTLGTSDTVSIMTEGNNHAVSITAATTTFDTLRMLKDDRIYGGDYILECTARIVANSSSADGRAFGFGSKSIENAGIGYKFAIKVRGDIDHFLKFGEATSYSEGGASLDICTDDNTLVGDTLRIRTVVDSDFGVSVWLLDGDNATLISATTNEKSAQWKADCKKNLGNEIYFHILSNLTVAFDDIEVWTTTKETDASVPQYLGYQTSIPSAENLYDIRFVAGVGDMNADTIGFEVSFRFTKGGQTTSGSKKIFCEYVYTSISASFGGEDLTAGDYGYTYLMALHINNVPSNIPVSFQVTPFAIVTEGGEEITKWSPSRSYVLGEAPTQNELLNLLPAYTGTNYGKSTSEFTTGYYRIHYEYTNLSSYNTYLDALVSNGFTHYGSNDLDGNLFNTYYNENLMVHVYYTPDTVSKWLKNNTITILVTDATSTALYPSAPTTDGLVTIPSLTMMDLQYEITANNGMSFVYTLEDGSYVIIDGGYGEEADVLYDYLRFNNKRTDGKIVIRAWIITHLDGDHIGCFNAFSPKYADKVTLEHFVAQFDQGHITGSYVDTVKTIYQNEARYTGCKNIVPLPGQVMYFGTLKVEFLYTAEMYEKYAGSALTGTNESSLVFKATLTGSAGVEETTVFFAADAVGKTLNLLTDRYSTALKSDILQLPHHGLNGTQALYTAIKPETILFCTGQSYADIRMDGTTFEAQNQISWLLSQSWAPNVFIADGGNQKIDVFTLPTITNGNYDTQKDSYTFDEVFGTN